jgi:uncharacterized protein (TIGR02246 family)
MNQKLVLMLIITTVISCKNQDADTKKEGEKLMQVSREWSKTAASRDVEKTLGYWADDAVVISSGQETLKGKQAIRQMVEGSLKNPSFNISWEPQSAEISKSGDMGYLIENTKITVTDSTGKPMIQNYKGITIWKKQADGSWKDEVDILSPESAAKK